MRVDGFVVCTGGLCRFAQKRFAAAAAVVPRNARRGGRLPSGDGVEAVMAWVEHDGVAEEPAMEIRRGRHGPATTRGERRTRINRKVGRRKDGRSKARSRGTR